MPWRGSTRIETTLACTRRRLARGSQWLRSTAVGRRQALRLTWLADEQGSGWLIHSGDADACALEPGGDGSLRCAEGTLVLRSHWLPVASRLREIGRAHV